MLELNNGYRVSVDVEGLNEYCSAFVAIYNNVRENPELKRVSNCAYNNVIDVICDYDSLNATCEWLSQWGKVTYQPVIIAEVIGDIASPSEWRKLESKAVDVCVMLGEDYDVENTCDEPIAWNGKEGV